MRAIPAIVLLVSAAITPLLAGRPVFHCRVNGSVGLVCNCAAGVVASADETSCCAQCAARARRCPTSIVLAAAGAAEPCPCCEITTFRVQHPPAPSSVEVPIATPGALLPSPRPAESERADAMRRRTATHLGAARAGPPLFLLGMILLI